MLAAVRRLEAENKQRRRQIQQLEGRVARNSPGESRLAGGPAPATELSVDVRRGRSANGETVFRPRMVKRWRRVLQQ